MTHENQNRAINTNAQSQELDNLLRRAMPPISPDQLEARINLWPQLRARIELQLDTNGSTGARRASRSTTIRVPWFDWALAALAAAGLFFFPRIIPALLYHF